MSEQTTNSTASARQAKIERMRTMRALADIGARTDGLSPSARAHYEEMALAALRLQQEIS